MKKVHRPAMRFPQNTRKPSTGGRDPKASAPLEELLTLLTLGLRPAPAETRLSLQSVLEQWLTTNEQNKEDNPNDPTSTAVESTGH